jgi:hypothetical protein
MSTDKQPSNHKERELMITELIFEHSDIALLKGAGIVARKARTQGFATQRRGLSAIVQFETSAKPRKSAS